MNTTHVKLVKCKFCKQPYKRIFTNQTCCTLKCAIEKVRADNSKKYRVDKKVRLEKLKTLTEHLKDAQVEFNSYIRARDEKLPCISCGSVSNATRNAGHYRTVKAAAQLRFNEDNCHAQCESCNSYKSGNIVEYRIRLSRKIGTERLEALESNNEIHKYTVEEAKEIKQKYREKLKSMRKAV